MSPLIHSYAHCPVAQPSTAPQGVIGLIHTLADGCSRLGARYPAGAPVIHTRIDIFPAQSTISGPSAQLFIRAGTLVCDRVDTAPHSGHLFIHGPLMSGQAAESGGSRPVIHTKAMPSPGQYGFVSLACILHLFIHTAFGRALANAGASLPASTYSYSRHPLARPPMALRRAVAVIHTQPRLPTLWIFKSSRHIIYSYGPRFIPASFIILGMRPCLHLFIHTPTAQWLNLPLPRRG